MVLVLLHTIVYHLTEVCLVSYCNCTMF